MTNNTHRKPFVCRQHRLVHFALVFMPLDRGTLRLCKKTQKSRPSHMDRYQAAQTLLGDYRCLLQFAANLQLSLSRIMESAPQHPPVPANLQLAPWPSAPRSWRVVGLAARGTAGPFPCGVCARIPRGPSKTWLSESHKLRAVCTPAWTSVA